jgi:hypothetical protein
MTRRDILWPAATPALALAVLWLAAAPAAAQVRTAPLSMEGAAQRTVHSAAAVGVGGLSLLVPDHAASMFQAPAMLGTVSGIQVSVGAVHRSADRSQTQRYAPVRYYPNLSLLLEGMTHLIPDPDALGFTPRDSVQRPFDAITPNWAQDHSSAALLQGFVAAPFELGGLRVVAGLGAAEYGDFGYYYQNNNVLSPDILSQRPVPISRPTEDNPLDVDWHQVSRQRQGAVMGYGGALAVEWARHSLTFGASGTVVSGSTEDFEQDLARGRLRFYANDFRLTPLDGQVTRTGRSEYSGFDSALGVALRGEHVSAGLTVRPPMTLTRRFTVDVVTAGAASSSLSGEDRLNLPWRGSAGIALTPREDLAFGLEYELRPLASARFTDAASRESNPWLSSSAFRFGAEYAPLPWLAVRGGMRREAEPFGADGRAIEDDPVWATAYTLGAGFSVAGARLNLGFETRDMNYQDVMGSAIHYNQDRRLLLVADVIYSLNRIR